MYSFPSKRKAWNEAVETVTKGTDQYTMKVPTCEREQHMDQQKKTMKGERRVTIDPTGKRH